ncbi:MAG: BrxE family protein [Cyanobacteriota bacterium]
MDFRQLFKLRLVVAALGETQRLGWWKSGVLTGTGEFLFQQGFPRSSTFAQSRAGFRVAQLACDEALAIQPTPGGPISYLLFRLTPQLEGAFENERNRWMDEPEERAGNFKGPWKLKSANGRAFMSEG